MSTLQTTTLLSSLFQQVDDERRLTVLHIGPALPETVDFFSAYRCKLFFVDLFAELPLRDEELADCSLEQQFARILALPEGIIFDVCLFWDLFNFLSSDAIAAFMTVLRPHLGPASLAHGFAVHNLASPQGDQLYGIKQLDALSVRSRDKVLPGYAPHAQRQLKQLLACFNFDQSVLLADSRLELLLSAHLAGGH